MAFSLLLFWAGVAATPSSLMLMNSLQPDGRLSYIFDNIKINTMASDEGVGSLESTSTKP